MANSSSGKLLARLVEIEVKSATLNSTDKKGSFYVRISVSEDQGLRTKLVNCSMDCSTGPSWNQKFVFSVPTDFVSDEKSVVCFTVFKARKYIPDLAVGQATCDMGAMFPVDECMKDESNSCYTDDDREYYYEPEIQEREAFEARAVVGVPILRGESAETGRLHLSICAWEQYYPYQLNLNGRLKKTYPIIKGSDKLGRLIMQRASSQDKYLWFEGNVRVRNLAMELEEFKMQHEIEQKKQPKKPTLCFSS